jgi:hypothetical protein
MILLFKSAQVLSNVPMHRVAVMAFRKTMLAKFHSGLSYSAAGHKFNVNESTLKLNKVICEQKQGYELVNKKIVTRGSRDHTLYFPRSNGSVFSNSTFMVT